MGATEQRLRWGLLALVLLAGPAPAPTGPRLASAAPAHSRSRAATPVVRPPLPRLDALEEVPGEQPPVEPAASPQPWRCADVDEDFVEVSREAERRCAVALEAAGCLPPTPFPEGAMPAEQVRELFAGTAAHCGISDSNLALDCTEYPCMMLVDIRAFGPDVDCLTLSDARQGLLWNTPDDNELAALGPKEHMFVKQILFPPTDRALSGANAAMRRGVNRFEQRLALVDATRLDTSQGGLTMAPAACAAREAMLDAAFDDDEVFCDAVLDAWGCEGRDAEQFEEEVDAALMAAEEKFAPECSNIDLSDIRVDCTLFPCVVTYPEPEEGARLCEREDFAMSGETPLGTLTTVPLIHEGDDEALHDFFRHRDFRAADAQRGYLLEVDPELVEEIEP
jgi:hypothetical protein